MNPQPGGGVMNVLERLSRIKNRLWIAVGVALGMTLLLIAVLVLVALLVQRWDARMAPGIIKNQVGIEFVSIPPGSFLMGSNDGGNDEKAAPNVSVGHSRHRTSGGRAAHVLRS